MMALFDLYNRRKESRSEAFNNNYESFVKKNPLWKGDVIPLHPINKNYMKITERLYNKSLMIQDLWTLCDNQNWISKDKDKQKWSSITLKSLDGGDQSFLIDTELGLGENNRYKYTIAMDYCPYLREIVESIPTDIYLVRILKLSARGKIKFHTDKVVFQRKREIIRCHIPIVTHKDIMFQIGFPKASPAPGYEIWDADILHERHLDAGYLWYTNVNTLHGVNNNSDIDRFHLVIDMRPTKEMLKIIYDM